MATGADLEPGTILAAYRTGVFPMPIGGRRAPMAWFSPVRRGVLRPRDLHVSRSLARSLRHFELRVDTACAEVIDACADPTRPSGWIDDQIREAYLRLHALGWVHSVETWRDGRLVGGLYGVAIGGLFAGRVDVPPRDRRVEGGAGGTGRVARRRSRTGWSTRSGRRRTWPRSASRRCRARSTAGSWTRFCPTPHLDVERFRREMRTPEGEGTVETDATDR